MNDVLDAPLDLADGDTAEVPPADTTPATAPASGTADATPTMPVAQVPDDLDPDVVNRLRLALLRTARNIRTNSVGEITQSQVAVLATLVRHGDCTVGQIAEYEHVQPPSASRILSHLEQRGLVERHDDPADRRRVLIGLSAAGRRYVAEVRAAGTTWLGTRLAELDPSERDAIEAALPALEHLLDITTGTTGPDKATS